MAEPFDPYLKWLGIPPEDQPANHYRLLGIPPLIDDPDVIANAADRQMMMLRSFQAGERVKLSQKLLNEVSQARVCLLDPHRKAAYDASLREADAFRQRSVEPAYVTTPPADAAPPVDVAEPPPQNIAAPPIHFTAPRAAQPAPPRDSNTGEFDPAEPLQFEAPQAVAQSDPTGWSGSFVLATKPHHERRPVKKAAVRGWLSRVPAGLYVAGVALVVIVLVSWQLSRGGSHVPATSELPGTEKKPEPAAPPSVAPSSVASQPVASPSAPAAPTSGPIADTPLQVEPTPPVRPAVAEEEDIVLADFEGKSWGEWKVSGDAFGPGPAHGKLNNQQEISHFKGQGFVNSYHGGDRGTGTLISAEFTIERKYVNLLIGGGNKPGTAVELLVGGRPVRFATGDFSERLSGRTWDVSPWKGRTAQIRIVDSSTDGWGHILADHIYQSDKRAVAPKPPR